MTKASGSDEAFAAWWEETAWSQEALARSTEETIRPEAVGAKLPASLAQTASAFGLLRGLESTMWGPQSAPQGASAKTRALGPVAGSDAASESASGEGLASGEDMQVGPPSLFALPLVSLEGALGQEEEGDALAVHREVLYRRLADGSYEEVKETRPPDFRLLEVLGEGGMGQVRLSHQHSLARDVAIKLLRPGDARDSAVLALLHEGRIMGALPHPNVIPVYALGRDLHGRPLLVMKRVEGVSWRALLRDPAHPHWSKAFSSQKEQLRHHLEIFLDVCHAVAFAHSRGILHLDLKPDNVMVGEYGEVYTLDWGLAMRIPQGHRAARFGDRDLASLVVRIAGTPAYMAPEMLSGELRFLDVRTDVYLLGATLHHILTGAPRHRAKTLKEVVRAALDSVPAVFGPDVPAGLAAICNKATHRDIDARFADVLALRDAVETYLAHRGSLQLTQIAFQRMQELEALIDKSRRQGAATSDEGADASGRNEAAEAAKETLAASLSVNGPASQEPDAAESSGQSDAAEQSGAAGASERSDVAEPSGQPDAAEQSGAAGASERSDVAEQLDAADPSEPSGAAEAGKGGLRAGLGVQHLSEVFVECQFGFRQALDSWPENPEAKEGLQACLRQMCAYELERGQVENAEALLRRMEKPDVALDKRLKELQAERLQARVEAQELREFRLEMDVVSMPKRTRRTLLWILVICFVLAFVLLPMFFSGSQRLSYVESFAVDLLFAAVVLAGFLWKREQWMARKIYRQVFVLLGLFVCYPPLLRLLSITLGVGLHVSIAMELFLDSLLLLVMGMLVRPGLYAAAGFAFCGGWLVALYPKEYEDIYVTTMLLVCIILVGVFYRWFKGAQTPVT